MDNRFTPFVMIFYSNSPSFFPTTVSSAVPFRTAFVHRQLAIPG
jgi:hypothetical protein